MVEVLGTPIEDDSGYFAESLSESEARALMNFLTFGGCGAARSLPMANWFDVFVDGNGDVYLGEGK